MGWTCSSDEGFKTNILYFDRETPLRGGRIARSRRCEDNIKVTEVLNLGALLPGTLSEIRNMLREFSGCYSCFIFGKSPIRTSPETGSATELLFMVFLSSLMFVNENGTLTHTCNSQSVGNPVICRWALYNFSS